MHTGDIRGGERELVVPQIDGPALMDLAYYVQPVTNAVLLAAVE